MGTLGLLILIIATDNYNLPSSTLCSHRHVIKLALIPRGKTSHHRAYMNSHDILLLLRVDWLLQQQ